ncbi:unnamed protein product [Hymenolepis diminuta]|uniref:Integrase_H2C2 domain-containing protein n=1 Tax=Hymenolepis diminuta TaxID=6216 RepID=A0A0R3SPP9_HYMDI|nr:unnamed protein product [Hymenolepis diminuta]
MTCDVSTGVPRLFVPRPFRRQVFKSLQCSPHRDQRATGKFVTDRFIWPSCQKDIANWTKTCQLSKMSDPITLDDLKKTLLLFMIAKLVCCCCCCGCGCGCGCGRGGF